METAIKTDLAAARAAIDAHLLPGAVGWTQSIHQRSRLEANELGVAELILCANQLHQLSDATRVKVLNWVIEVSPEWLRRWWWLVDQVTQTRHAKSQSNFLSISNPQFDDRQVDALCDAEAWFAQRTPELRKQLGIYHTSDPLVDHCWARMNLARWSDAATGEILDPAAGTGAFVCGGLRAIAKSDAPFQESISLRLSAFLSRMVGVEVTVASWLIGFLRIGVTLSELGYDFLNPKLLRWWWGDATRTRTVDGACSDDLLKQDYGWVVGNPPYSSRVEQSHTQIEKLLRGEVTGPGGSIDYHRFRGEPLGERKTWLHDLYVRFFRLSQWWTARSHSATVALITNRGWLDHKTFRGMREALATDFPEIEIEEPELGTTWFNIATSTCFTILRRRCNKETLHPAAQSVSTDFNQVGVSRKIAEPTIEHRRIRFLETATNRLSVVSQQIGAPREPWFEFDLGDGKDDSQLRAISWSLTEIFQQIGSAIVTARDALVIGTSRRELEQRMNELLDCSISDQTLRERYFRKARSRRFEPGDTRGWKLSEVRERLRQRFCATVTLPESQGQSPSAQTWRKRFQRCRYRGLDDRWIIWDADLVDWPRFDSQATLSQGDLGLIARRQSPVQRSADYVLVTDCLVVDGVVRSDNRGNESVFALHRMEDSRSVSNVHPAWRKAFETVTSRGKKSLATKTSADELDRLSFGYLYAVLRTPSFRSHFHDGLVRDFPRVPLVNDAEFVAAMIELGSEMIARHLRPLEPEAAGCKTSEVSLACDTGEAHDVTASTTDSLDRVTQDQIERWTLGAHAPVQRWRRDRGLKKVSGPGEQKKRSPAATPIERRDERLCETVRWTIQAERRLDRIVSGFGGWEQLCQQVLRPNSGFEPS